LERAKIKKKKSALLSKRNNKKYIKIKFLLKRERESDQYVKKKIIFFLNKIKIKLHLWLQEAKKII
jgi:hypothetical protein